MPIASNPDTGEVLFLDKEGQWKPATTAVNPETKEMMAFDGAGWSPVLKTKGALNYVDDAMRSIASGITFGWADEFAAKMDETLGRGTYANNLQKEQSRDAQIPITIKLPGEIAGAVGTTALVAPLGVVKAIAATTKSLPAWLRFAGLGAAEGALAGAGNADPDSRGTGAAIGAGVGGAIGAVTPTVVDAVSSVSRNVVGAFNPKTGATADIARAVARDEMTPATFADRFFATNAQRPGVATVADAGGENVKGLVERIAQTPGAGRTIVVPTLTARQTQQLSRISADLADLTGAEKTARQTIETTIKQRAQAADPLYKVALDFNADQAADVVQAWQKATSTGWGKQLVNTSSFRKMLQTEYGIQNAADAPLMVQIDTFKQLSDDLVGTAIRNGNNNQGRVIRNMTGDLLEVVDTANPAYREARKAWAGPTKFMEAIDEGKSILSAKADAEEFAARIAAMTDSEKEAARIGAVSAIKAKIGNDPAALADLTKYLRSPEMRKKVAAIMPTEEAAAAWNKRLSFEMDSSKLTGQALGNSATARRLAEMEDAKGIVGDLVVDAMTSGAGSISILSQLFRKGRGVLRDTLRSRTDKEIADILLNPKRADELPKLIQRMQSGNRIWISPSDTAKAAATAAGVAVAE